MLYYSSRENSIHIYTYTYMYTHISIQLRGKRNGSNSGKR